MGLLEKIGGSILGSLTSGGQKSQLMGAVLGFLNDPKSGGLSGLVQGFSEKGLGNLADSWVGTGKNLPASADQIKQGLNPQMLQAVAAKAGIQPDQVAGQLAKLLPGLVDKLTPQGALPDSSALQQGIGEMMKKFGGK